MLLSPVGFFYDRNISALKLVASNRSTSTSLVAPMNIQAGDLLLYYNQTENVSAAAASTPSGFTSIHDLGPSSWVVQPNPEGYKFKARLSYKIADGTEAGATITGMAISTFRNIPEQLILVYRSNRPVTSVSLVNWSTSSSSRTLAITPSHAPLLAIACYAADNVIDESKMSFSPTPTNSVNGLNNFFKYRAKLFKAETEVDNVSLTFTQTGSGAGGSGGGTLDKTFFSGYLRIFGD